MRVLFTSTPGWGHIHPMVPLADAFRERGDEVAWAVAGEVAPRLESVRYRVFPAGLGARDAWDAVRTAHPEIEQITHESTRRGFPMMFGAARAEPMLDDLLPLSERWRPALVVHEQGELAAPIAAASYGIPSITHAFGQVIDPANLDPDELGVSALWKSNGLEALEFGGCYRHMYVDMYPPSLHAADLSHIGRIQPIRSVAFATGTAEPLPDWIGAASNPLVYVTFGTVFNENARVIRTVVEGVRSLPVRVVVTVGPNADPSMLGDQPPNVHVTHYIPQTQLLPHCAAVVSHGGSGTFLAALAEGLPQVCVPQGADQFNNAAAGTAGGAAVSLMPDELTVESVRARTEAILGDPAFRRAAEKVQHEIAAMPSPADVAEVITASLGAGEGRA